MDTIQILLLIVLTVSTIIITLVGIQLVIILYQVRRILSQSHKIVKSFDAVGVGLQHGLGEMTGFVNGLRTIVKIVEVYRNRKKND